MCDDDTFACFKSLAKIPMGFLSTGDLLFLTGHDACCGERSRKESKRQLFLAKVKTELQA